MSDQEVVEAAIKRFERNLLYIYKMIPESWRDRAKLWYEGANRLARVWAERYGISQAQDSAVLAALSPNKDWYNNITQAERILDFLSVAQDSTVTPEMIAVGDRILIFRKKD